MFVVNKLNTGRVSENIFQVPKIYAMVVKNL